MKQIITILMLISGLALQAQFSSSSIGLRGGGLSGISFKYADEDMKGFELIAGGKDGGFVFTGLLEHYRPIATGTMNGFFMFIGGGAHAGYSRYEEYFYKYEDGTQYHGHSEDVDPVFGGDFILGGEYRFESIPLILSLDYKPYFELFGRKDFRLDLWDIGFSVRYAIN